MNITLQNESGKHYICLDKSDYTCYPFESEILLQAGISAKVEFSYEKSVNGEPFTVFNLYISEEQVNYFKRKKKLMIIIPASIYFATQFIEAEMQIRYEYQHKTFERIPIVAVAFVKLLLLIAFIPPLLRYKLYSGFPVILA